MLQKGSNVIIGNNVSFGENVVIGNNVVIYEGTIIGNNVIIQDNAVVGKQPTRAKASILPEVEKLPPTEIGSGVTISTSAIIYANAKIADDVFVADLATIRERVTIGEKTIIGRGVAVENDCAVGSFCKLETNCYITAYSELEDYVFIAPCVVTTNDNYMARDKERFDKFKGVTVKKGGRIGANSTILPGKIINEEGAVAAGSLVSKDVERENLVMGSPAKKYKPVDESQLLKNQ
ncbi:acyltransferase [Metasolibacillus sp.]|uniref:acyltransferase n=1 Tax=Metasolibacillus sp. TaxID=2703680 RepID=UPI0025CB9B6E|nr:acyltransferase [Metasolibacillus sp.]MCT6923379.1 acetyltransferase [Metasolibacillus sp.]MCT6939898.1 acetyltransferase [Metasolibacillus sp.]